MSKTEPRLWENIYPVYSVGEVSESFTRSTLEKATGFISGELRTIKKKEEDKKYPGPISFLRTVPSGYRSASDDVRLANRYVRFVHMGQADSMTHFMAVELKPDEEGYQTQFLYKWDRVSPKMKLRQIAVVSNSRFEGPLAVGTGGLEPVDVLRIASVLGELGVKEKNG